MAVSSGCQSKLHQCNELVELLNEAATRMDTLKPDEENLEQGARVTREMATVAQSTATRLAALELSDEVLVAQAGKYRTILQQMSTGTEQLAGFIEAMAQLRAQAAGEANARLEQTRSALESKCSTRSVDCNKVMDAMSKIPRNPAEEDVAEVLSSYADQLAGLELSSDLGPAVLEHVAAVRAFVAILEQAATLQTQADTGQATLDGVLGSEQQLVGEINRYCVGSPAGSAAP